MGAVNQQWMSTATQYVSDAVEQTYASTWTQQVVDKVTQLFGAEHMLVVTGASEQTFKKSLKVVVETEGETHDVKQSFTVNAQVDVALHANQEARVVGVSGVEVFSPKRIELATEGASIVLEGSKITITAGVIDVIAGAGDLVLRGGPMVKINT